ncbi:MAG TPA: ABC transporter permease [Solirubrobacterales bacterium]|nr:ABC transporter permease [Solirubrobacterales bacterium]
MSSTQSTPAPLAADRPPAVGGGRVLGKLRGAFDGSGAYWLLVPAVLFLGLLLVVPLVYLLLLALETTPAGETGVGHVLSDADFLASLWRTFVLAAVVSVLTLLLGTLYALALAVSPRWLAILMLVALFTIFWTSLLVRTYGWMLLYLPEGGLYTALHAVGLRDTPLEIFQTNFASYPAMVHVMLPFVVFPVFAATRQIDPMQIRAARVLGARPPLILWKVVLPALRAGMAAGAVLVFVMSLGFFVTPALLGSQTEPLVAQMIGQAFHAPGEAPVAAAMSLALVVIVVVVYVVADRVFRVSETWGAEAK